MNHFGSSAGKVHWILVLALLLILVGGFVAYRVQTDGGKIAIRDVRFMGSNNIMMSGLLYIPKGVDAKNKAPGILAVHGYINSRETQDGFAIEFARRGYVVLALDQTGHGYSDPPLLPQNKMLPERIVCEGAFGEGFKDSIKFILHGLS